MRTEFIQEARDALNSLGSQIMTLRDTLGTEGSPLDEDDKKVLRLCGSQRLDESFMILSGLYQAGKYNQFFEHLEQMSTFDRWCI